MANRLTRLADVHYTPAVPYQPAVPGYCVQVPYYQPAYYEQKLIIYTDDAGIVHFWFVTGDYHPAGTYYRKVCYPAIPEIKGTPATTTYTAATGWDGGARSIAQLDGSGVFQFNVKGNPAGVVIGLSETNLGQLPNEATHALYIHGTVVDVIERGVIVATASISHAEGNLYKISRSGLFVTYSSGSWSYRSDQQCAGARFADAAMYASGDYVDNPAFGAAVTSGRASGSLARMFGAGYQGSAYRSAVGSLARMTGTGTGRKLAGGSGSLRALFGVAADRPYTYATGALGHLTGTANGGYPNVTILYGVGTMAPLAGVGISLTGEIGHAAGSLGRMSGVASEGPYAQAAGSLQPLNGYARDSVDPVGEAHEPEVVVFADFFVGFNNPTASISTTLDLGDDYAYVMIVDGVYYDALLLGDNATLYQTLSAAIHDSLRLGTDLSNLIIVDIDGPRVVNSQPVQYAVNTQTGALSTYSNFGFTSFAVVDQVAYASKADGVYVLRSGDDDGSPITAAADFGGTNYGSTTMKNIEALYVGLATDGQVYLRMRPDDGPERVFLARQRGPGYRTLGNKRVGGRNWNITLEVVDATLMDLDCVEHCIFDLKRRWMGSR